MTEETIFEAALGKRVPAERSAYLDEACGGDRALQQRVELLLKTYEKVGTFLERPAVEQLAAASPAGVDATAAIAHSTGENEIDAAGQDGTPTPDTQAEGDIGPGTDLRFLQPSRNPEHLGRLKHYEIVEILGKGGFGTVFKAHDEALDRVVAIKVLAPQLATNATARRRFTREAKAAAAVSHDHVVGIYAVEEAEGIPYIAMQLVHGKTLQERLDQSGPLELREILRIGMQIAEG